MSLNDPHKILDVQLKFHYPNALIIKKPEEQFNKKPYLLKVLLQFKWFLQTLHLLYHSKNKEVVFREFDNFGCLYLFCIFKRRVMFNINHNLCSKSGRVTCFLLSLRFNLLMIDCPADLLRRFPYIVTKRSVIEPERSIGLKEKKLMILVGNRREQFSSVHSDIHKITRSAVEAGFQDVLIIGTLVQGGIFLSDKKFNQELKSRLVINLVSYENRHSGTIWTLLKQAPKFFQRYSNVAAVQIKGMENGILFKNSAELIELIYNFEC